ncbi:hypothetical protein [Gemmobacter sp.]|uniref:hypothetical protein n=1 Tax=Gemmobacter sp. TaxID=1898957 RepID=UPI002AFDE91D|nr:hypothetical protein [Gemmobacter sp.]
MIRKFVPLAAVLALVACGGGNPLNFGGTTTPEPEPTDPGEIGGEAPITGIEVPGVIAQHLKAANYTPGAPTMAIDLRTLDGTPLAATYQRATVYDVAGFEAYTVQETSSQRQFLALFKRGEAVQAGTVADGGQFVNYFGGATFSRVQPFSLPTPETPSSTLLATYTGGYVGLLNWGEPTGGADDEFSPVRSYRVTGDVMMNADFNADNLSVNGGVRNRQIVDTGESLQTIFFWVTQITDQGSFSGLIKFDPTKTIGNYAGVFGGSGGSEVAGATILRPIDGDSIAREHGAFVATKCVAGDPAPCP